LEKFRILYFISGILFLAVSAAGGSWWELVAGEASKPVLYVGLSPFEFRVELLGARAVNPSPLMNAFFHFRKTPRPPWVGYGDHWLTAPGKTLVQEAS
jgi:hypothetical protein